MHHPSCPSGTHVHRVHGLFRLDGWTVFLAGDRTSVVFAANRHLAERVAALLTEHGIVDVPDHLPPDWTWGPPDPRDRIIDWRLQEHP